MAGSFNVEYSDMIDQQGIKAALFKIHEMFAFNGFVNLNDIEKIIVLSPTEVKIVTTDSIKIFEYDSSFRKMMYVRSSEKRA